MRIPDGRGMSSIENLPPKTKEAEAEQAHCERHALHDGCWQEEDDEQRKENVKTMIRVGQ